MPKARTKEIDPLANINLPPPYLAEEIYQQAIERIKKRDEEKYNKGGENTNATN